MRHVSHPDAMVLSKFNFNVSCSILLDLLTIVIQFLTVPMHSESHLRFIAAYGLVESQKSQFHSPCSFDAVDFFVGDVHLH